MPLILDFCVSECVVPGAGATEIATHRELMKYKETVKGKARLGIQAFAEALLVIPKTLGKPAQFEKQLSSLYCSLHSMYQ